MAEDIQKIKVSELPEARSLTGLFALGVDNTNKSVKVGLEFLESAAAGYLGWYGIEWDSTIANSACTRIGKHELHVSLPIQRRMRRCLLRDDGTVSYYLHPNDSTKTDTGMPADLSGASGQVMVEIPEHYRRFESEGTKRRAKLSEFAMPGFMRVPKMYVSAYEATVERSTSKLASVVNATVGYRGGGNQSAWDGTYRSQLGMPATAISLTNYRNYARNRGLGWNCYLYEAHKTITWLYFVEYANLNSQLSFNPTPTAQGYKQGGLGAGVTTLNITHWNDFNSYYPVIPCGVSNALGDNTGIVMVSMPAEYSVPTTVEVPSYRGIENPFGHLFKWTDGLKCRIMAGGSSDVSEFYVCDNPSLYQDADYDGYTLRGLLPRANGYIRELLLGESGDIMPLSTGGGSTTYFSDYFYTSLPAAGESQRGVLYGGSANRGADAGLVCSNTNNAPSAAWADVGSRLCYLPA